MGSSETMIWMLRRHLTIVLSRANLHFHVKHGWLSEGKERWSSRSIAYDELIGSIAVCLCLLGRGRQQVHDSWPAGRGVLGVQHTSWCRYRDIIKEVGNENMRMMFKLTMGVRGNGEEGDHWEWKSDHHSPWSRRPQLAFDWNIHIQHTMFVRIVL